MVRWIGAVGESAGAPMTLRARPARAEEIAADRANEVARVPLSAIEWGTNDGKPVPLPTDDQLDDDFLFDQQQLMCGHVLLVRHIVNTVTAVAAFALLPRKIGLPLSIGLSVMLVVVGGAVHLLAKRSGRVPNYAPIADAVVLCGVLWLAPTSAPYVLAIGLGYFAIGLAAYGAIDALAGIGLLLGVFVATRLSKGAAAIPAPDFASLVVLVAAVPGAGWLHLRHRRLERSTRMKYLELLGGLDAVVWEADPETLQLTFVSPQVREIFGVPPQIFIRNWEDHVHPDDRAKEAQSRRGALENGEEEFILEHRMITREGSLLHVRNKFSVVYDGNRRPRRVRGAILDVTRQQEAEATIRKQAQYDTLTGLPNRSLFNEQLKRRLDEARRSSEGLAVLLLDLNGFKEVNDTLGHAVGDHLLQAIAGRLAAYLPERSLVARLGGDEFAVMVYPSTPRAAASIAESIASCLQPPITIDAMTIQAGAATGIALYPGDGDSPASLLRRADAAMYEAKQSGRTHMFATPDDDEANVRRLQLLGELRASITTGDFRLFHQPKVDLRTGAIVGTEGLIRWQHRKFGLLSPAEFVELTELSGLIQPLTRWVIEQGIRDLADWRRRGYELKVALNLSVRNFFDQGLPSFIAQLLSDFNVPGDQLVLEITEREVMADRALARSALSAFRSLDVKISIDDFGTGFSSLSQLQQLPIDEIKVDQSFVQGMLTNPQDGVIVRSIIDLGHNLDLEVVAEGAEDFEQLAALRDLGADRAQGYVISKPVPGDQFTTWLASLEHRKVGGRTLLIFPGAPLGDAAPGKFGSSSGRVLVAAGSRATDARPKVATSVIAEPPVAVAPVDPRPVETVDVDRRTDPFGAAGIDSDHARAGAAERGPGLPGLSISRLLPSAAATASTSDPIAAFAPAVVPGTVAGDPATVPASASRSTDSTFVEASSGAGTATASTVRAEVAVEDQVTPDPTPTDRPAPPVGRADAVLDRLHDLLLNRATDTVSGPEIVVAPAIAPAPPIVASVAASPAVEPVFPFPSIGAHAPADSALTAVVTAAPQASPAAAVPSQRSIADTPLDAFPIALPDDWRELLAQR